MPIIPMIWRRRLTSSAKWLLSGSGRGLAGGLMRSSKRAITSASSVSVFASRPTARAKSRIWHGLTMQSGSPAAASAVATVASTPPVAARPHALRVRLPDLDERARTPQARSNRPHAGTEQGSMESVFWVGANFRHPQALSLKPRIDFPMRT